MDVGKRKKEKNHISRICAPKRCPSKIVHRGGKSRRNLEEIRRAGKGMAAHFFERTHVRIRAGPKQLPISWLSINRCAGFNNPAADCYRCLVHKTRPEYIARHSDDNRSNFNRGRGGRRNWIADV